MLFSSPALYVSTLFPYVISAPTVFVSSIDSECFYSGAGIVGGFGVVVIWLKNVLSNSWRSGIEVSLDISVFGEM
jgi:hypothetical protein